MSRISTPAPRSNTGDNGHGNPQLIPLPPGILNPQNRTDVANSRRVVRLATGRLLYCSAWKKWLAWDGKRYVPDGTALAKELGKAVGRAVWTEILATIQQGTGNGETTTLSKFGTYTESDRGIAAMLSLASSDPAVQVTPDHLDSHPYLLNVGNGVLNLRDGTLRDHDPTMKLTQICPTEYRGNAACPVWLATIDKIFAGDAALVEYLQRLLGMSLIGESIGDILSVWWGRGRNGKTTIIETLLDLLGDYACKAPAELLLASHQSRHPQERMVLYRQRLAFCSELDEGRRWNESLLKELTGRDRISGRRMHENEWSYTPSHNLFVATNHKPEVRTGGDAMWARLRLLPFLVRFWTQSKGESGPPALQADEHLQKKLHAEKPGILAWLVHGCLLGQRSGLTQPAPVTLATSDYRTEQDVMSQWFADCCTVNVTYHSSAKAAMQSYTQYCQDEGFHVASGKRLGEFLRAQPGLVPVKRSSMTYDNLHITLSQSGEATANLLKSQPGQTGGPAR